MKRSLCLSVLAVCSLSCREREPDSDGSSSKAGASSLPVASTAPGRPPASPARVQAMPAASVAPSPDDPLKGKFTLQQATDGLPPGDSLRAVLHTSVGRVSCELWPDKAPNTVANFVGLARGLRPWKQNDVWVTKPLYDGTELYSVIKNFAIEGGSPSARFNTEIGYFIADERWPDARHDARGLLCMRAFTPGRSGAQFLILDGPTPQLDHSFTIFGKCGPTAMLDTISNVPTENGRPKPPIKLRRVEIARTKG